MATLTAVRKGLVDVLSKIPRLTVERSLVEITTVGDGGSLIVGGPTADYVGAQGRGNMTWNIPVYVLASTADYAAATQTLDELVAPFGDRSVIEYVWNYGRAEVEPAYAPGGLGVLDSNGLVDVDAHIDTLVAYGVEFPNAGVPHLGAILNCVVHTPGRPT